MQNSSGFADGLDSLPLWVKALVVLSLIGFLAWMTRESWLGELKYQWMKFKHHLPVIGSIAKLAKLPLAVDKSSAQLWTSPEKELADQYHTFYRVHESDPGIFNKAIDYLEKVNESGKSPMPVWLLLLTVGLVIIEAIAFGFAIAPYAAVNLSASQVTVVATVGAILLAVLSCGLAHFAGEESAYNRKMKTVRTLWENDRTEKKGNLVQKKTVALTNTYDDNNEPEEAFWRQICRRIVIEGGEALPQYKAHIALVLVVILLGGLAFFLRYSALNANLVEIAQSAGVNTGGSGTSGMFEATPGAGAALSDTEKQGAEDQISALKQAFYTTFIIFSIVYVGVQAIMYWLTSKYTMVGEHSRKAWKYTHRFSSAQQLTRKLELIRVRINGDAEKALNKLRSRMRGKAHTELEQQAMESDACGAKTFLSYCDLQADIAHETEMKNADREMERRRKEQEEKQARASGFQSSPAAAPAASPVGQIATPAPVVPAAPASTAEPVNAQDQVLKEILKTQKLEDLSPQELEASLEDLRDEFSADWLTLEQLETIQARQIAKRKRTGSVA